jgi:hypothetical protein
MKGLEDAQMTFSASTNSWARNGGTAPLKLPDLPAQPEAEAEPPEAPAAEEAEKGA